MAQGAGASAPDVSEELAGRLRAVGRAVSPDEIGELWIFPPLPDVEASAEFLLFTRLLEEDRRRVYSARVVRGANGDGVGDGGAAGGNGVPADGAPCHGETGQRITEHGSVPAGRVSRLVDRFRRRLEEEGEPRHLVIEGRRDRWAALVRENGRPAGVGGGSSGPRDGAEAARGGIRPPVPPRGG